MAGVARNRFLIYTSSDIRALYAFKRFAWLPYGYVMTWVNVVFTRTLRPRSAIPAVGLEAKRMDTDV